MATEPEPRALGLADWLTIAYFSVLGAWVAFSNHLFAAFVASKPEGRKTVIGRMTKILNKIPKKSYEILLKQNTTSPTYVHFS
jgi:hypothetical protein